MTVMVEDRAETRVYGLVADLRAAEVELRRSYARMLSLVAELDAERAGAVGGFGSTARLLSGVLNLSRSEAKARVEQAEQTLASSARRFDPAALSRIGERLLAYLDPDGREPVEEPEQVRELRVRTGSDGTVSLSGRLDSEGGARVLEVLNSLNARRPPVDGMPDLRCPARRNADALVEAMSCLLDAGELPARGGQRPHLVLTMPLTDLIDGLGSAVLDTGGRICAAEARRLACDAGVVPMVLGGDSMPLDVGRQQRLATTALRDALARRDQGCAFPSCDRPPRYCHAHHIRSWLDGGETKLANLCLLCEAHHVVVHRQGWCIRLDARGHPEFIPPTIIDPTRTPLHNPLRQ